MVGSTREYPTNSIIPAIPIEDLLNCSFTNLDLGHDEVGCNHVGSSSNTSANQAPRQEVSDNWSANSGVHRQQYFSLPSTGHNSNIWKFHHSPSYAGQGALLLNRNSYVNGGYLANGSRNQHVGNSIRPRPELFLPADRLIMWAKTEEGSKYMQWFLQQSESDANMILKKVFDFMFELMMDEHGHHLFQRLVEAYADKYQLQLIVNKITLQPRSLVIVALHQYGSKSILSLIQQLKKSSWAFQMTQALSFGFYDLMISRIGRNVITQCFTLFHYRTNEVLYLAAVRMCVALATHPMGCVSLNNCIDFITGEHRRSLLRVISDNSVFLSYDPSGNFVVQHVLGLYNQEFTANICNRLRGNYTQLSMMQNGSHVVEKCIKSGEGMRYVVEELIKSNKLAELARDKFGNYVIQTALKTTRCVDINLYRYLVRALQPHLSTLQHRKPGKYVVELIRDL